VYGRGEGCICQEGSHRHHHIPVVFAQPCRFDDRVDLPTCSGDSQTFGMDGKDHVIAGNVEILYDQSSRKP